MGLRKKFGAADLHGVTFYEILGPPQPIPANSGWTPVLKWAYSYGTGDR